MLNFTEYLQCFEEELLNNLQKIYDGSLEEEIFLEEREYKEILNKEIELNEAVSSKIPFEKFKNKLFNDVQEAVKKIIDDASFEYYDLISNNILIDENSKGTCKITIPSLVSSREIRRKILLELMTVLNKMGYIIKGNTTLNTSGDSSYLRTDKFPATKLQIVCKQDTLQRNKSTAFNLHDYIGDFKSETITFNASFPNVNCFVFNHVRDLKNIITICTGLNYMEKDTGKFLKIHKKIIKNCLNLKGISNEILTSGIEIPGLKNDPKILISFGEILVPYLILKGLLEFPASEKDNPFINSSEWKKTIYILHSANIKKIDYVISFEKPDDRKIVMVSAKFGKGHAPSIARAIIDYWGKIFNDVNLQESPMTRLHDALLRANKNIVKAFWEMYLGNDVTITENGKKVNLSGKDLYTKMHEIVKTPETEENKKIINSLRQWFVNNFKSKTVEILKGKEFINWNKVLGEPFPSSISYIFSKLFEAEMKYSDVGMQQLKTLVGKVPYYQARINQDDAERGILKLTVKEINSNIDIELHIPHSMSEIDMGTGSIGYILK